MRISLMLELAYWYSFWLFPMTMRATSTSQRTLSSYAFFSRPCFLLLKVICEEGRGGER